MSQPARERTFEHGRDLVPVEHADARAEGREGGIAAGGGDDDPLAHGRRGEHDVQARVRVTDRDARFAGDRRDQTDAETRRARQSL